MSSADVPGAKFGITDWFVAKKNHTIAIPESLVVSEAAYVASGSKKPQHLSTKQDPPLDDPMAMARDYGMTKRQFVAEQQKILKEAEKQKKQQDKKTASQNRESREMEEVKLAMGGSISVAAQEQLFADIRKRGQEEGGGSQGWQQHLHPDQSSLDKGGIRRQHSWQPAEHTYEVMPGNLADEDRARDRADKHRHVGMQGKSSSIALGDGISDSFHREGQQHHGANSRHLDVIPGPPGSPNQQQQQQNRLHHQEQMQAHENIHGHMGHHHHAQGGYTVPPHGGDQQQGTGGVAPHPQHDDKKDYSHHDYVNLETFPQEPHSRCYSETGAAVEQQSNAQRQWPSDQPQHPPAQPQPGVLASTIQPGSNVRPNPHLGIGSRIQLPTNTPNEPFKYGVIRWIGEVPQIQGAVAGIELVSDIHCTVHVHVQCIHTY